MSFRRKCVVVQGFILFLSCWVSADDLIFIHHSVGQDWFDRGLRDALTAKNYVDSVQEITYGTALTPDPGRPASLGDVPGDSTDMQTWILWFNDYVGKVLTYNASSGFNRIVMFKSCFPNSDIWSDGAEPGDPFSDEKTLGNYRAVYRHPSGAGATYHSSGRTYRPLEDIFAAHPDTLFIPVTAPPLSWGESTNANAHRARLFNDWLRNNWLASYNSAHPNLHNVAVFNLFDLLAYADNHSSHPNRLKQEYGGDSGDSHPNEAGDALLTQVFATSPGNFIDQAWSAFNGGVCVYSIDPTSSDQDATGGTGNISVSSGSGCSWTSQSNDSWISVTSGSSGSGNGMVGYGVAANGTTSERTGTVTVAGQTFTVRQTAGQDPTYSLLFPAFFQGIHSHFLNSFVGVAVSNPSDYEAQLTARGFTEGGQETTQKGLWPIVPPYGQRAFLSAEAIDPPGTTRTLAIEAQSAPIRGFFMIGENSLNRLDGVGDQWARAHTLYFPLVKRDSSNETTVYVLNPSGTDTTATLTWIGPDGKTIAQALMAVVAHGCIARSVGQIFPPSSVASAGYLKVVSPQELTGCLVHSDEESFLALPAVPAAQVQRLFAPHFYVPAQGGGTELRLINTGTSTVSVRVRAFKDGHELLGEASHDIAAETIWVADLGALMHLPVESLAEGEAYSGYLELDIRAGMLWQPGWVVGAIVFSGNNRRFAAALPLIEQGYRETLIPHVAQSSAFHVFTGLAVLNVGVEAAAVTVQAVDPAGEESGRRDFSLQPGERAVDLLNGPVFFGPEFSQNGGYLRVSSTQPLVSFALFGDSGLAYMAAIGGQGMDE
jgi:hypothetical protein